MWQLRAEVEAMQQNEPQESFAREKQAANVVLFVLMAVAMSLEVFFRRRFGPRYFGLHTVVALLGIPLWMLLWPRESASALLVFWALFVIMILRARVESFFRGQGEHSRFNGYPWLALILKRTPEWQIKGGAEPLLAFLMGVLLLPLSQPLGSYLMFAALALGACQAITRSVQLARARDLNDALIEQQLNMERFHELRDRDRLQ
jgi:hypothetical protein